jgi:sugar-specific transcriptional regulator TrmB
MSVSHETKEALRELGLTGYETQAYLSLLEKGGMTASQVSEAAEVPYSKIYETLNSLSKKGWIKIERGRPSRYYPKAPSEALEAAKLRFESRIRSWEQSLQGELQELYEKRAVREKPDIWIIRGEFNVLAKLREMLGIVKNELMLAVPSFPKELVNLVYPVLTGLRRAGVKILLMVSKGVKEETLEKISQVAEIRIRDHMFGGGIIADGKEAVLLLGEEDKPNLIIWADHVGLVKFAKDYFEYLWNTAKSVNNA